MQEYSGPIIDFHIHPYLSEKENLCMYLEDFSLSIEEGMADLQQNGITHVCGSVIATRERGPLTDFEEIRKCNRTGTGLFRYGMLAAGVKAVGAERILFGTDYPITNPGMYVHAVLGERISDADREKIFYLNAKRILRMESMEFRK